MGSVEGESGITGRVDLNIPEKTAALVVVAGARLLLFWPAEALTTPIFRNTCQPTQTSSQSLAFPDF